MQYKLFFFFENISKKAFKTVVLREIIENRLGLLSLKTCSDSFFKAFARKTARASPK
jgi:hypothetical protein